MPKSARKLHLEALRILASFLVLFNHTGEQGFFLFAAYPPQHPAYWLYLALSIACKAAVPIFFMVSGALLLEDSREEPLRVLFRKRILRTALLLVLISLVYYLWQRVLWDAPASLPEFLELLYAGRVITPLWYLYAYLGFLLALPLLRRLARALGNREFFYWAALALLFQGLLPTLSAWLWKEQAPACGLSLGWLLEQAVFYPCLGYFAEHRLQQTQLTRRRIALLWLGSLAGIAISALLTARAGRQHARHLSAACAAHEPAATLHACRNAYGPWLQPHARHPAVLRNRLAGGLCPEPASQAAARAEKTAVNPVFEKSTLKGCFFHSRWAIGKSFDFRLR